MNKYRKALYITNDGKYPYLFLREDGIYSLIQADGTLSGDGFDDKVEVLKYFPNAVLD
jgi:hypothetical protein